MRLLNNIKDIQKQIDYNLNTIASPMENSRLLDIKLEIHLKFEKALEPYCRNNLLSKNKYYTRKA